MQIVWSNFVLIFIEKTVQVKFMYHQLVGKDDQIAYH